MSIAGSTTYSYRDLTGSLTIGGATFQFTGQKGVRSIAINMVTDHSSMETAADGAVMVNQMVGDSATVTIECQQTSSLHHFLLNQYNIIKTAVQADDLTLAAAGSILIRSILDGASHTGLGLTFSRIPPKTYAAAGAYVSWLLNAPDMQNL